MPVYVFLNTKTLRSLLFKFFIFATTPFLVLFPTLQNFKTSFFIIKKVHR